MRRLDVSKLQRIYDQWGPSTRLCLNLAYYTDSEGPHEENVIKAAEEFIESAPSFSSINIMTVSHILFKMEPKGDTSEYRQTPIGHIATDTIKKIILYAAAEANAHARIKFYNMISKQTAFRTTAGKFFEEFVLSWFHAHTDVSIPCHAADATSPPLQIPACGVDQTVFFGSTSALRKRSREKTFPMLLLPESERYPTADAIILTEKLIITIQVTIADNHKAKGAGFATISEDISVVVKLNKPWYHVFIADNEDSARSLRNQSFSELPSGVRIYSAVFDVGTPTILREHVVRFDNQRVSARVSASWLRAIGAYESYDHQRQEHVLELNDNHNSAAMEVE